MGLLLQQLANSLVLGAAYVLVALGLFLIFSVLHIPNFAHGETAALGAYFQYLFVVQIGVPFFWALLPTMALVAIVAYILERTIFRSLQGAHLIAVLIAALALAIIIQETIGIIWGSSPLGVPTPVAGVTDVAGIRMSNYRLLIVVIVLAVAALLSLLVYGSGYGRKLRAMAQNREAAQLCGVNVKRIGSATFVLGSVLGGLAGGLLSAAAPINPHMGFHMVLVAFVILVVVGQGGRLKTVLLGGFAIALLETLTAGYYANAMRHAAVFIALVAFLMWRPEGAIRQAAAERAQL